MRITRIAPILTVDDVEAAHRAAVDAGLEIAHPLSSEEWGVRRFFYRDSSGRVVNVGTHLSSSPGEHTGRGTPWAGRTIPRARQW